jgi:hypothetical protein
VYFCKAGIYYWVFSIFVNGIKAVDNGSRLWRKYFRCKSVAETKFNRKIYKQAYAKNKGQFILVACCQQKVING